MGLVDAISKEDRVEVKFSDFYAIIKQAAQKENIMNGVNCNVPHEYIREMVTGKAEQREQEIEALEVTVEFETDEYAMIAEATRSLLAKWDDAEAVTEAAGHIIEIVDTLEKARIHEIVSKSVEAPKAEDTGRKNVAAGENVTAEEEQRKEQTEP